MRENIPAASMHDSVKSASGTKKVGVYDRPEHSGPSKTTVIIGLVVVAVVITLLARYFF